MGYNAWLLKTSGYHNFAPCPLNKNRATFYITCTCFLLCATNCHTFVIWLNSPNSADEENEEQRGCIT